MDAHIWNDIMDLEIDRREKSRETGRDRPLVYGWATVADYRRMSAIITILVVVLAAYLTIYRVFIPFLFIIGFFFDYGYNHPRYALAHEPFTEWYIFPWLVVAVTVTIVYAATGIFSLLAFILSLLHGTDGDLFCRLHDAPGRQFRPAGREMHIFSTVPELPHSTIFGIITMFVSVLMIYPLALVLGNFGLAYILVLATAIIAGINTVLGARIDQFCTRAMYSVFPDFEAKANKLMLQQVGATMVHAVAISIILVVFGGIV